MDGVPSSRGYRGGFPIALMLKDLDLAIEAGDKANARTPLTRHVRSLYEQTAKQSSPALDFTSIYQFVYDNEINK